MLLVKVLLIEKKNVLIYNLLNVHSGYVKIDAYLLQFLCHMTSDVKIVFFSLFPLLFKSFILKNKKSLTIKEILIFLEGVVHRCS